MNLSHALFLAASATLLTACGDGPQADEMTAPPAAATEVPPSATASPAAYTQFAASLADSETRAPLDVNQVTPPTSETAAPLAL